jgi:radical SAM superfamily enzyme YgiQ (UPF0313 family)
MTRTVLIRLATWLDRPAAHPENVMAPLELGWAASLLEGAGHEMILLDTELGHWDGRSLPAAVEAFEPDLVVVHATSTSVPLMLQLAGRWRLKLPRAVLLASGQHATVLPETLLEAGAFHAAAVREPEETIFEVAEALAARRSLDTVPGLVLAGGSSVVRTAERPLRDDLDALPLPAHRLFRDRNYRVYHPTGLRRRIKWGFAMTSRGCPYPCVYCSGTLRNSSGRGYRRRSPENVWTEVRLLQSLGRTVMHFKDDIFTFDRDHSLALLDRLAHNPDGVMPFTVQTRVDHVDAELFGALRRAGCRTVGFGVESGSPTTIKRLKKMSTVDQARTAFALAREAGLLRVGFFLLGNPDETEDDIRMTLELAHELDPDIVQVGFLTPYPGTGTWKELPEAERPTDWANLSHYNQAWNPSQVSTEDLLAWQRRFYRELVLTPRFLSRYAWTRRWELLLNPERELPFAKEAVRFLARRAFA